ncbi:MAG: DODA-type extradiol aromatic ring-opening family dioxygenase [Stenotrophobium sp.]
MDSPAYRGIFISHGAPTLALDHHPAHDFLAALGRALPRPRAIVVLSPHWRTAAFAVKHAGRFRAVHDFSGFPPELYELRYTPPGAPELAAEVEGIIAASGLPTGRVMDDGIDHGVWIPLMLMYPQADVPVVPVSISSAGPEAHFQLGRALAGLGHDDVLILGSGGAVHNLHEISLTGPVPEWAAGFDEWTCRQVLAGDWQALQAYRRLAPQAARAHPTEEHFMPLFVAGGVAGQATVLHRSFSYGSLGMAAYGFSPI